MRRTFATLPLLAPLVATALASVLWGCTVGPNYVEPTVAAAPSWGAEPGGGASRTAPGAIDAAWWRNFDDPELSALVHRLARENLGLQEAAERVRQAQAATAVALSQGLPSINGQSSVIHQRESPNGFISLVQPSPDSTLVFDIWRNALSASWELDLFGRVRRSVEAARANTASAVEARREMALESVAQLAQDYMELRGTQVRIAIARSNLVLAERNLELVHQRFVDGVATKLETSQAEAQRASILSTIPPLESMEAELINAIGLLLALPPRALAAELAPPQALPPLPALVPVGMPGDVVRQRPDVRQAEDQLHAAVAEEGVAIASFYPDVTLTGSFGMEGLNIANAFSLPSRTFQVGPSVSLPLFRGGELTGTLKLRRSQQRAAALAFRQTVLQAWQDVDNALTAYAEMQRQGTALADAVAQDRVALAMSRQRYAAGATDFLNVITSEQSLLRDQDQLAVNQQGQRTTLVTLYRALGGGWQVAEPKA